MADEETTLSNERKEQIEPIAEIPEGFEEIVKGLDMGVEDIITEAKHVGDNEINSLERDGLAEEAEEMKKAIDETTEEAKEAKEKYEEDLKNIPNFDDKIEAIEKEEEVRKETQGEYDEKLKDIPNPKDLAKSFRVEKSIEEPVVETEELPAEPKVKERKDGKLFDCLSEINVSMEAINMKDQEAAIKKIDSALSDLDSFIIDNQEAIYNNQELEIIINAVRKTLEEGKSIIEKSRNDAKINEEDIKQPSLDMANEAFMKDRLNKLEEDGLGGSTEAKYINRKLGKEQEIDNNSNKDKESEDPSVVTEEAETESPVEYYQDTYDDIMKGIEEIINSDKNSYEKIDDLDREKEALKGRNDNFIPDDILKDEGVKEMIQDMSKEFDIVRAKIEESKTEEEKKSDAKKVVDFVVNNSNKSLDFLKKSEETPSGKMSSLKGAMSLLESSTEKYKDIINSDEKLKGKLESARSKINSALEKQEQLQATNDKLAAKYDV